MVGVCEVVPEVEQGEGALLEEEAEAAVEHEVDADAVCELRRHLRRVAPRLLVYLVDELPLIARRELRHADDIEHRPRSWGLDERQHQRLLGSHEQLAAMGERRNGGGEYVEEEEDGARRVEGAADGPEGDGVGRAHLVVELVNRGGGEEAGELSEEADPHRRDGDAAELLEVEQRVEEAAEVAPRRVWVGRGALHHKQTHLR